MCGIYAAVNIVNATEQVRAGIKRLDYRGYDSWGVMGLLEGSLVIEKDVGIAPDSLKISGGEVAIAHTRWATHGGVTKTNAHPHLSRSGYFGLAHNGIVENFLELKRLVLSAGYSLETETDSEVIVRLIEMEMKSQKTFCEAVEVVMGKVEGRNAVVILNQEGRLLGYRNGSPLVMGVSDEGVVIASDMSSMAGEMDKAGLIDNNMLVEVVGSGEISFVSNGKRQVSEIEMEEMVVNNLDESLSNNAEDYMLREITQTPEAVLGGYDAWSLNTYELAKDISKNKVMVIGSGTAGVAAKSVAYLLRVVAGVDAMGLLPEELVSYEQMIDERTVVIALSQSGETADVLQVLERIRSKVGALVSYVNMQGSMMIKMSDVPIMANAGVEKAVMSTKVFVSQVVWGWCLSEFVAGKSVDSVRRVINDWSDEMREMISSASMDEMLETWVKKLKNERSILLVGDGLGKMMMDEAQIKLIEGAYIPTLSISAASLKHFAITLIEEGTVVVVNTFGGNKKLIENAIKEVEARGAEVLINNMENGYKSHESVEIRGDKLLVVIASVVPMQLLAYKLSKALGNNVDKPRNIAKSVTVL